MGTPTKGNKLNEGHKVLVGEKDYSYNKDVSRAQLTKLLMLLTSCGNSLSKEGTLARENPFL